MKKSKQPAPAPLRLRTIRVVPTKGLETITGGGGTLATARGGTPTQTGRGSTE
jgi:hypothetical protein